MDTAARSTAPQRLPSGADTPDVVTVLVHTEAGAWWADSPDLPGLVIADDDRETLIDAVGSAVEYYVEETPDLQGRVLDVQIVDVEPE